VLDVQIARRVNASENTGAPNFPQSEDPNRNRRIKTRVARYGERYWAVYVGGELLAVTIYKKGALAVQNALTHLSRV
jgi:hypothetical protein